MLIALAGSVVLLLSDQHVIGPRRELKGGDELLQNPTLHWVGMECVSEYVCTVSGPGSTHGRGLQGVVGAASAALYPECCREVKAGRASLPDGSRPILEDNLDSVPLRSIWRDGIASVRVGKKPP